MHDLVRRIFELQGARVRADGLRLEVALPPDLAPSFDGADTLHLAFHARELDEGATLVGPGAPLLDRLAALLASRGRTLARALAAREDTPPGTGLRAATGCSLAVHDERALDVTECAVLYRLTACGADRVDALVTVTLAPDAPAVVTEGTAPFDRLLALASAATAARDHPPPRIPLADAETAVRTFARDWARAPEASARRALHRELTRLASHAAAAIDEAPLASRPALEARYREAREALLASHRVRVHATPLAAAAVSFPARVYALVAARGEARVPFSSRVNLATGLAEPPPCAACGEARTEVSACEPGGHVVCSECARTCARCARAFCAACDAHPCAFGPEVSCARCHARCDACGREACAAHRVACPRCRGAACPSCAGACAGCSILQCRHHLRPCARCDAAHCPGCLACCAACGAPVCARHRAACAACGQVHCADCLAPCPRCEAPLCAADRTSHAGEHAP
jgi:hypothetical protein